MNKSVIASVLLVLTCAITFSGAAAPKAGASVWAVDFVKPKEGQRDNYLEYLEATGLKDYGTVAGNLGVRALRKVDGGIADFLIVTYWESMDAVKRFAGENPEVAVYYPEDDAFLLEKEPFVSHYDVVFES